MGIKFEKQKADRGSTENRAGVFCLWVEGFFHLELFTYCLFF
jgi:hypothetical protein